MKHVKTGAELLAAFDEATVEFKNDLSLILNKITIDSFDMLIRRSAKDTGFLRSNWAVSVDTPAINNILHNPGDRQYADANIPAINISFDSVINLYNNTEYAIYLENGTPTMWSQPMIRPTVMATNQQLSYAAELLSKKKYYV